MFLERYFYMKKMSTNTKLSVIAQRSQYPWLIFGESQNFRTANTSAYLSRIFYFTNEKPELYIFMRNMGFSRVAFNFFKGCGTTSTSESMD